MAVFIVQGGSRLETVTPAEMRDIISAAERERARGIKEMYLPEVLSGKVASSAIALGAAKGIVLGPEAGYTWFFRRLVVSGLATGGTPDIVNLYRRDDFGGVPLWQFNGNNFGYTWATGELWIHGGETLNLQNVGTLAATGVITLGGALIEVPAEMAGRLLMS